MHWNFMTFYKNHNEDLKKILISIENAQSTLCQGVGIFNEYIMLLRNDSLDSKIKEDKMAALAKKLETQRLTFEVEGLISIIYDLQTNSDFHGKVCPTFILIKLQNFLRVTKAKKTKEFYRLYKFRSDLSDRTQESNVGQITQEFVQYWNEFFAKSDYFKSEVLPTDKDVIHLSAFIGRCIDIFEQKFMAEIFSIELFLERTDLFF